MGNLRPCTSSSPQTSFVSNSANVRAVATLAGFRDCLLLSPKRKDSCLIAAPPKPAQIHDNHILDIVDIVMAAGHQQSSAGFITALHAYLHEISPEAVDPKQACAILPGTTASRGGVCCISYLLQSPDQLDARYIYHLSIIFLTIYFAIYPAIYSTIYHTIYSAIYHAIYLIVCELIRLMPCQHRKENIHGGLPEMYVVTGPLKDIENTHP